LHGVINVLKPPGISSAGVVNHIKNFLNCKKAGHTGTLDPQAAGVLPICIGKGTKIANYIMSQKKTYICEATLGKETDTDDIEGNVIFKCDNFSYNEKDIEQVLLSFKGDIIQVPPIYSAIRYKGKRSYELAREGKYITPKARTVTIYDIELLDFFSPNKFLFKIECSKGTYIRSLCRDIGKTLGCGAYMSFLIRTQTGEFELDNSFTFDEIKCFYEKDTVDKFLIPIDKALTNFNSITVDDEQFERLINGSPIHLKYIKDSTLPIEVQLDTNEVLFKIYCKNKFIGIGFLQKNNDTNGYLRIKKLLL